MSELIKRQVGFIEAIRLAYHGCMTYRGRSRRSEYWWFVLFSCLGYYPWTFGWYVGSWSLAAAQFEVLFGLFQLIWLLSFLPIFFLPWLSLSVRRMHDVNRSGFWLLGYFVPIVGWIILWIVKAQPSQSRSNVYGADPRFAGNLVGAR